VPGGYYDPLKPDYNEKGEGRTEAEAVKAFAGNHQPYRPLSWITGDDLLLLCDGVDTMLTHTVEAGGTHIVTER
jgi:hypothetical protein